MLTRLLPGGAVALVLLLLVAAVVPIPVTPYMYAESRRLGGIDAEWRSIDRLPDTAALAVLAAEDARFCQHAGFDFEAIRTVLQADQRRGASTISQQVVKNVFLWHGRSWLRKGLEAGLTPLVELLWTKRRILEVYLNVAEFDRGVFGVAAAARHYYGAPIESLDLGRIARLAALLPAPKRRSASTPTAFVLERAADIARGARTLRAEGRAACVMAPDAD